MQLNSFGSILSFAAEMEAKDGMFYAAAMAMNNGECSSYKTTFEQIAADCQKNQKTIQRIRRENITEMILEGINDFSSAIYEAEHDAPDAMQGSDVLKAAVTLEKRAEQYYLDAAEKIKALSEVARELKMLAKKRTAHLKKLSDL